MFMHVCSEGRIITDAKKLQMHHGNIKRVFLKQGRGTTGINVVLFLGICPGSKRSGILPSFKGMKRARPRRARTGPLPLPKWVLQTVRSNASSFTFQYLLVSLRSSSNCLLLLPHLPGPFIFPSRAMVGNLYTGMLKIEVC